jgi:hypothetical protein
MGRLRGTIGRRAGSLLEDFRKSEPMDVEAALSQLSLQRGAGEGITLPLRRELTRKGIEALDGAPFNVGS